MPEQRRIVTILFADVTGSTALGESLDPEDVRALMGRYFAHARRVVADHGGSLEKFIGDAVMAVFGLTHAWGDDAERALAAALALRSAIAGDDVLARWLTLRMGVNTGEVVATDDASRNDFLITGDAVNVAARLEQHAAPGEILASARTMTAARSAFAFGPVRQIEAKGKSQPLSVFPLIERQTRPTSARPPLVGRRQDLLQLEVLKARALEERQPQMLTILAPAGTGKSRLVEEFLARLDADDGFRVAALHCQPYGETLAFAPLRELLSDLLDGEVSQRRIADAFVSGAMAPGEAEPLARAVLQPLSSDNEGGTDRESVFGAWRLLLESLARNQPQIVILEDMHWASDSLLDLVETMMRPRPPATLLLIVLSRPELLDRRPAWSGGQRNTTLMTLQPLSDTQTRELVGRLTEGMSDETCASIAARAAGNPFFAAELARALGERRARGDSAPADESLPDTVHAAVQARLDLLAPEERVAMQAASVAGQTFSARLLGVTLPERSSAAVSQTLENLLERDLLEPASGGNYTFRHALIREVAYGSLARAERMRLHAALADWLDTRRDLDAQSDVNDLELTAYHYCQAVTLAHQSAVPLEAPIDVTRAVAAMEQSGTQAGRTGAFGEACNCLNAALIVAPSADHTRLYEELGDSGGWSEAAVVAYRQALEHWRASGANDPLIGARLLRKILVFSFRANLSARLTADAAAPLRAEAEQLVTLADDEDERWHLRVADLFMANLPADQWRTTMTMAEGMEAVSYFEAKGDWPAFSEALDGCAVLALHIESYPEVLAVSQRRLTAPELPAAERGDAVSMIVRAYISLGEFTRGIQAFEDVLERLQPDSPAIYLSDALAGVTVAYWMTGRWQELDRIKALFSEEYGSLDERISLLMSCSIGMLQIALCREDTAAIQQSFADVERILTADLYPYDYMLVQLYRTGDPSAITFGASGLPHFRSALWFILMYLCEYDLPPSPELLAIARAENPAWQAPPWRALSETAIALDAADWPRLAAAIDAAEACELIPFAAHMRIVLAERCGDPAPLALARPVLERLGDTLFLQKLEEVAARLA